MSHCARRERLRIRLRLFRGAGTTNSGQVADVGLRLMWLPWKLAETSRQTGDRPILRRLELARHSDARALRRRELVDADFRNSRGCVSPSPARTTDTRVWQVMSYARHTENQFLIAPYLSLIVLISACSIFGAANGSSSTIPIPSAGQWVDFGRNEPTISSGAFTFPGQAELPATFTLGPRQR